MGKKGLFTGLAAGAVIGAVTALVMKMNDKERDVKLKAAQKAAKDISTQVAKHGKSLSKLTKAAYHQIVDTTVGEYKGVKALSQSDLAELKKELKADWVRLEKILKGK